MRLPRRATSGGLPDEARRELLRLLNPNYLKLTNMTTSSGVHSLPVLHCAPKVLPDYIALYGNPGEYHKTELTCVCFHQYDVEFDGQNGLWAAIHYNNEKQLEEFKERFEGVKFFISPDYSQLGDVSDIENHHRILRARVVSMWLTVEVGAVVIPLVTFPTLESIDFALDGLEECEVVAFSTKGSMDDPAERGILTESVRYTVDTLGKLRAIIVYDVCMDDEKAKDVFAYATEHGVEVVIPPNKLKERNAVLRLKRLAERGGGADGQDER